MGYRVDYERGKKNGGRSRKGWMCFGAFAFFWALVIRFWPEGRRVAAEFLFSGGAEHACQAAEEFAQDLSGGMPIGEAVQAFCRDILSGAGIP